MIHQQHMVLSQPSYPTQPACLGFLPGPLPSSHHEPGQLTASALHSFEVPTWKEDVDKEAWLVRNRVSFDPCLNFQIYVYLGIK